MRHARHSGFTLIELVIVIVILGILAAAALPRFSNLSTDARVAAINGLAGSLRSAAAIAKATQLAKNFSLGQTVTLDGTAIAMSGGFPTAAAISEALTDFSGFTLAAVNTSPAANPPAVEFTLGSLTNCVVRYTEAGASTAASVSVVTSGC